MVCTLGISRVYWFSRRTENYHFLIVFLGSNFCRQKWNIPETYGFWRNYYLGWFPKLSFDRRWFGYSTGGLFHTYYARYWRTPKVQTYLGDFSLQSRRNGGRRVTGRVLWINLVRTMAAIFNFYNSGGLGRERNLYQGGEWRSKRRSWERWGNEYFATLSSFPTPSPSIHSTSKSNMVIGIIDCELRNVNLPP